MLVLRTHSCHVSVLERSEASYVHSFACFWFSACHISCVKRNAGSHTPGVSEFVMAGVTGFLMLIRRLGLDVGWGCFDKQVGGGGGVFHTNTTAVVI